MHRVLQDIRKRDKNVKTLINTKISKVDRIRMRVCRQSCGAKPREEEGQLAKSSEQ